MSRDFSMFETSHSLGTCIASSPLTAEAWRQCAFADARPGEFISVQLVDAVVYVAFSGLPILQSLTTPGGIAGGFFSAVPIAGVGASAGELFSQLVGGDAALVHAPSLHCFLTAYNTPLFQKVLEESPGKALVFTGRSAGGSVAALAALCLLCQSRTFPSPPASLMCVTFGSPFLGNEAFSRAVLQEGWGGSFCHVVSRGDVVPRILLCPVDSIAPDLVAQLLLIQSGPSRPADQVLPGSSIASAELLSFVSGHARATSSSAQQSSSLYRPFGSYLFCSAQGGAICVHDAKVVMKLMHLTLAMDPHVGDENISYGELMDRAWRCSLRKGRCLDEETVAPISSHDAGIWLALEASGIQHNDMEAREAEECLRAASTIEHIPALECAKLSRKLAVVTPLRAQIEWYKSSFDERLGYYDAFKRSDLSKMELHVDMNRRRLAKFWDSVLDMLESNQLPHDFLTRHKWVNASQFYKLLVEPLDIADYYRKQRHRTRGHYITHGRERRYKVFDQWWKDKETRTAGGGGGMSSATKRTQYAGLTQDSCFWGRLEVARDAAEKARAERDPQALRELGKFMGEFDGYAKGLIERKEVSIDVLAEGSSYRLWEKEWEQLRPELGYWNNDDGDGDGSSKLKPLRYRDDEG